MGSCSAGINPNKTIGASGVLDQGGLEKNPNKTLGASDVLDQGGWRREV